MAEKAASKKNLSKRHPNVPEVKISLEETKLICHTLLRKGYRESYINALNLHYELFEHGGGPDKKTLGIKSAAEDLVDDSFAYQRVKTNFSYNDIPKVISELTEELIQSVEKCESIHKQLKDLPDENTDPSVFDTALDVFDKLLSGFIPEDSIPEKIPKKVNPGFLKDKPDLVDQVRKLKVFYGKRFYKLNRLFDAH